MVSAAGQAVLGAEARVATRSAIRYCRAFSAFSNTAAGLAMNVHLSSDTASDVQQKRLAAHTNPFHHSDRFSITPPPHATKPASDPHKYIPNHSSGQMDLEHANRLPLFQVPRNIKRSGVYTMKVGEDSKFRPKSPELGMDKQLFELPEYPTQGRRFTDVLRHFSVGFRPEEDEKKLKPHDVFEDAPLYSSFTKDNVFPKVADTSQPGALGSSMRLSRSGRRSKSAMDMAPIENPPTLPLSDAIESRASTVQRQSFGLSERGAAASPIGVYSETYIRAPSVELSRTAGARSPGGVRAGGLQLMLGGQ